MDTKIIAVVGLNRSGKTFFIGSSLPLAYQYAYLRNYFNGFICAFDALEETDRILVNEYQHKMDLDGMLDSTNPEDKTLKPLLFRVCLANGYQFILVLYDLSGEVFMDARRRAHDAAFLEWSDGVIFLADPTTMRMVPKLKGVDIEQWKRSGGDILREVSQVNLLSKVIDTVYGKYDGSRPQHLAVVVTKGDLIYGVPGISNVQTISSETDYLNNKDIAIARIGTVDFLRAAGEGRIVDLVQNAPSFSFHTVSTGKNSGDTWVNGFAPIRVLDPWAVTLGVLGGMRGYYTEVRRSEAPTRTVGNESVPAVNVAQGSQHRNEQNPVPRYDSQTGQPLYATPSVESMPKPSIRSVFNNIFRGGGQ
jgi:hypothetical protein